MACKPIKTKFGNADIGVDGYYYITSRKEGNHSKRLHRLIFEDFYQTKLPKNIIVHHVDGNRQNNNIWNLIPMRNDEHTIHHHTGKKLSKSQSVEFSAVKNNTGLYRVHKHKCASCRQGFRWWYSYIENGKARAITSINLSDLKQKVLARGLDWIVLDEEQVKKIWEELE